MTEIVGEDHLTLKAIEFDADLCATEVVFRWAQMLPGNQLDDLSTKRIVMYSVVCGLINFPKSNEKSKSHLGIADRISHILCKLAAVRANPFSAPDPNLKTDESKIASNALMKVVFDCYKAYSTRKKISFDVIQKELLAVGTTRLEEVTQVVIRWEEIKYKVAILSGTHT